MGRIAFLFPGQGSQTVGMGQDLYACDEAIRALFHGTDEILGVAWRDMLFHGPEESLKLTENAQPALVLTGLAASHLVISRTTLRPDFVAGHSLGEYAAIAVGGGFSALDAIRLVRLRGEAMRTACPAGEGGMAALLNLSSEDVEAICRQAAEETSGVCAPANYNTTGQIVISGHKHTVERAMALAKSVKGRGIALAVSAPFHCSLMDKAAVTMAEVLDQQAIHDLHTPLVANVTARETTSGTDIKRQLVEQITAPVQWEASIRRLIELGVDTFVELGTGQVLTGMMKRINKDVRALAVNGPDDLAKITALA